MWKPSKKVNDQKVRKTNLISLPVKRTVDTCEAEPFADFWVGSALVGSLRKPTIRRFLRIRDENLMCKYFYWTEPHRGNMVPVVQYFRKRVKLTEEQVIAHFKTLPQ